MKKTPACARSREWKSLTKMRRDERRGEHRRGGGQRPEPRSPRARRPSYAPHRRAAEEAGRLNEQHAEDDCERDRQPQVGADPVDVGADQVDEDAEQQRSDDRAEAGCRVRRAQRRRTRTGAPAASGSGRSSPVRARSAFRRPPPSRPPGPSRARASSSPGCRAGALASGLTAAAREASPSLVKRKKSQSSPTAPSETAIVPRSWIEKATPAIVDRPGREGVRQAAHLRRPDPARGAVDEEEESERDDHHRQHRRVARRAG